MIDPNRIADIFMAVVLVLMAAINMHTYIRKGRYKESGGNIISTCTGSVNGLGVYEEYFIF